MTTTAVAKPKAEKKDLAPIQVDGAQLVFHSHSDMYRAARQVATSGIIPKAFQGRPDDIFVAWMTGAEHGFSPMQSLNAIVVINGRASMYAEAMTALVLNSGLCEDHACTYSGQGKTRTAHCKTTRKGIPTPHEATFSIADAETAGLLSNPNYKKYPDAMLMARAKSINYRIMFPDVLKGMRSQEEVVTIPAARGQDQRVNVTPSRVVHDPILDADDDEEIVDAEVTTPDPAPDQAQAAEVTEQPEGAEASAEVQAAPEGYDASNHTKPTNDLVKLAANKLGCELWEAAERIEQHAGKPLGDLSPEDRIGVKSALEDDKL